MAITYHQQGCDFTLRGKTKISTWIKQVIAAEGRKTGEIALVFCSDEALLKINREYLQHDYLTDIITFDYTEEGDPRISGDLMISVDTVASNAPSFDETFERELRRVIVHGVLHLLGYGDKTAAEKHSMRTLEDHYLKEYETPISQLK